METIQQIQNRHRDEVNNFEGMFFAFNNDQLSEGMKKVGLATDDFKSIVSIGSGGYLRKDRVKDFTDMFKRHAEERKQARQIMKTIKIKFKGIDGWNRPVFKTLEAPYRYFGSVTTLFDYGVTEDDVLKKIDEDDLVYFGNSFDCEPMGTDSGNIEIVSQLINA